MRFLKSLLNPVLLVCICLCGGNSEAVEQDPPPQVVKEVGRLWMVASPLWDAHSQEERADADARWKRIEEIGEDQVSRALVVLYQQKAGVDRPFMKEPRPGLVPESGPEHDRYVLVMDSIEKARMTMILNRDPRRVEKFLPILRERLKWLISYVPNDHGVSALDGMEIDAVARYIVKYGTEEDRRLLKELGQKYAESSNPEAALRAETVRQCFENAANIAKHERKGFPFIRPMSRLQALAKSTASSEGAPVTAGPPATAGPPDSTPGSPSLASQAQISETSSSGWWVSASLAVVLVLVVVVVARGRRSAK